MSLIDPTKTWAERANDFVATIERAATTMSTRSVSNSQTGRRVIFTSKTGHYDGGFKYRIDGKEVTRAQVVALYAGEGLKDAT